MSYQKGYLLMKGSETSGAVNYLVGHLSENLRKAMDTST